ncbi:MAG: hypothetical protein ABSG59_16795 [Verrucomicrobiota bacterium]|jgi:transcriptional regulator with XRE-family HTH domain
MEYKIFDNIGGLEPGPVHEIEVIKELALAVKSRRHDISDDLRRRARSLPLYAFVWLFSRIWLAEMRGLASAGKEKQRLETIGRLCEDFAVTALDDLEVDAIALMRLKLETGKLPDGEIVYACGSAKAYIGALNRFLQFLGVPPLRLIEPEKLAPMLLSTELGTRKRAVGRMERQLSHSERREVIWKEALFQVRREGEWRGEAAGEIERKVANCQKLLDVSGQKIGDPAPTEFLLAVGSALDQRGDGDGAVKFPAGSLTDARFQGDIRALLRNCQALAEANFSAALFRCLPFCSGKSYGEICTEAGLARNQLKVWVAECPRYTTNIIPSQVLKLDELFAAGGNLFASYAATTQHTAFEVMPTVRDMLLGRTSFGQELRRNRKRLHKTARQVMDEIAETTGIKACASLLTVWEHGTCLPSLSQQRLIAALDAYFDADGDLEQVWRNDWPREVYTAYRLSFEDWPEDLQRQYHRIVLYKTINPEGLPESPAAAGDRWTDMTSEIGFRDFSETLFGYLKNGIKKFRPEELSFTLLCDRQLVQGLYDFIRERAHRKSYSQFAQSNSRTLLNLYRYFMPILAAVAAVEKRWQDRLLAEAEAINGASEEQKAELLDPTKWEARWRYHLYLAVEDTKEFLRCSTFESQRLSKKAWPLIEQDIALGLILKELHRRAHNMPTIILSPKAAICSRRLTLAIFAVLCTFRTATFLRLRTEHVVVPGDAWVRLAVPESLLRSHGKGGGKGGVSGNVQEIEWAHDEIRRYVKQSRPILVGDDTESDSGHFFTAGGGQIMIEEALERDFRMILGYTAFGQRDVFTARAVTQGMSLEDAAIQLQSTAAMVAKTIKDLPPLKTRQANTDMESLQRPPGKSNRSK